MPITFVDPKGVLRSIPRQPIQVTTTTYSNTKSIFITTSKSLPRVESNSISYNCNENEENFLTARTKRKTCDGIIADNLLASEDLFSHSGSLFISAELFGSQKLVSFSSRDTNSTEGYVFNYITLGKYQNYNFSLFKTPLVDLNSKIIDSYYISHADIFELSSSLGFGQKNIHHIYDSKRTGLKVAFLKFPTVLVKDFSSNSFCSCTIICDFLRIFWYLDAFDFSSCCTINTVNASFFPLKSMSQISQLVNVLFQRSPKSTLCASFSLRKISSKSEESDLNSAFYYNSDILMTYDVVALISPLGNDLSNIIMSNETFMYNTTSFEHVPTLVIIPALEVT